MPIVVPPGTGTINPPVTATSPDGLLKATAWPGGDGVLLEANFHGTDGSPGSPEVVNRTNLMTQTGVQGTTVGSLWSVIVMPATLSAVAAAGGQPGYRRVTMTADQTSTAGPAVFDSAGGQVAAGDVVSAAAWVTLPRAMAVRVYVFYYNGSSGLGSTYTETAVPANTRTRVAHNNTAVAPAGTNRVHVRIYPVYVAGSALTNGQTWIIEDDITIVKGSTVGSTFNGTTPAVGGKAYRYTGTPGDSTSQEYTPAVPAVPATPQSQWPYKVTFYRGDQLVRSGDPAFSPGGQAIAFDAEAPLGQGSTWYAVGTRRDGTTITSQPVGLMIADIDTNTYDIWIKSLNEPGLSMPLAVVNDPDEPYEAVTNFQPVPGSRYPTGSYNRHTSATRDYTIETTTHPQWAQLKALLDSGPLLLQTAAIAGTSDFYAVALNITGSYLVGGFDPTRHTTVQFQPVARQATLEAPLFIPGRSYDDTQKVAPTYTDSSSMWPTYADIWQPA